MVKNVYLYRHAQAEHNATSNWGIPDPTLTPLGRAQSSDIFAAFKEQFSGATSPQPLLVCSPLRRTVETMLLGFPEWVKPVFMPELQEINDLPCDTGSSASRLSELFPELDFTSLPSDWNTKRGPWAPEEQALQARARVVRRWLREQPGENAVVVSHGDFLRYYLASGADEEPQAHWDNAEGRLYVFESHEEGDEKAWLVRIEEKTAKVPDPQDGSRTSAEMRE
ncbi:phosphoglycerate mutase-like protein [Dacryopinax primogenitus]|uniref:Phosphoglycerate mutase-like protein n=1 Tax=Dacryopinax primogenitus (strain DJM 731) TaxID=1858805 RepID=M5G610_DACPD|nr:phosphoglycerate mutase-like protein [Dacryopinax primogenitus]EJU05686.1 phosphoglycerate mutase-like protein [Dacryopinax primogenitus]